MSKLVYSISSRDLEFKFLAGTSKGTLRSKKSIFLKVWKEDNPHVFGLGEFGPLSWLSPDFHVSEKEIMYALPNDWEEGKSILELVGQLPEAWPGVRFALESSLLDLAGGGKRILYPSAFTEQGRGLLINGLVWMNEPDHMWLQVEDLIRRGFKHIKCKVGALDFDTELAFLERLRQHYTDVELRLDANGAFSPKEAMQKLERLAPLQIHSIEQPIATGNWEAMTALCATSPIPIALDEELIGIMGTQRDVLLETLQPAYCIFKPMLIGGLYATEEWIRACEQRKIQWWLTSMLESNLGLNAICQFAATKSNPLPQGLGTGSLFSNNLDSPLSLEGPYMYYRLDHPWDNPEF
jgi:o-succinylbenzoate synthase